MSKAIVILGGGTGGTLVANRLRRALDRDAADILVIAADDEHIYQPGLLFVPFGQADPGSLTRPRRSQLRSGVSFRQAVVDRVDLDENHKMEQLDIPSIPEFVEMIADTGAGLYACKASADLFGITKADLIDQVKDIITVGEFYDMAAGGEIIFT